MAYATCSSSDPSKTKDSSSSSSSSSSCCDKRRCKKRVRFANSHIVKYITSIRDMSSKEKANAWWSPNAQRESYLAALDLSAIAMSDCWMIQGFENAFEESKQAALLLHVADNEESNSSTPTVEVSRELLDWCRYGHSWRGLEQLSSASHKQARKVVAWKARNIVLESSIAALDPDTIRVSYQQASRPAAIFAAAMGEADALAAVGSAHCKRDKSSGCIAKCTTRWWK